MGKKEMQKIAEDVESAPKITPELLRATYEALESRGALFYSDKGVYVPTERGWKLLMEIKPVKEEINAYGSKEIKATDLKSISITKDEDINDSTIAIKANKACKDLKKEIKSALKDGKKIEITIECEGVTEKIIAFGSPALKLDDDKVIEIRKDDKIDKKTLAIMANKSANELSQELIDSLRKDGNKVKITLEIK
jgi:hypothetical protein